MCRRGREGQSSPTPFLLLANIARLTISIGLSIKHPDWDITTSTYEASNTQDFDEIITNLTFLKNVDATRLHEGRITGGQRYDAIVFNAPRSTLGGKWRRATSILIDQTLASVWNVLKPGGHIRFSSSRNMPGTTHLNRLLLDNPPGYVSQPKASYLTDQTWFVPGYKPRTLTGRELGTQSLEWYIFTKAGG